MALLDFLVSHLQALLNNIGRELLCGQSDHVAGDSRHQLARLVPRALLQHVLNDVVTERVLHQQQRMLNDVGCQRFTLFLCGSVQATLQHTAAVAVTSYHQTLSVDGINHKRAIADRQVLQAAL